MDERKAVDPSQYEALTAALNELRQLLITAGASAGLIVVTGPTGTLSA